MNAEEQYEEWRQQRRQVEPDERFVSEVMARVDRAGAARDPSVGRWARRWLAAAACVGGSLLIAYRLGSLLLYLTIWAGSVS
jgi:hypothetical protein